LKTGNYFGGKQPKKFTEEQREQYLQEYLDGMTYQQICEKHGMVMSNLTKHVKSKAYGTGRGAEFEAAKKRNRLSK